MSQPPHNAASVDCAGLTEAERIKAARAMLTTHEYVYQRRDILYGTTSKWWNEEDLKEDGYESVSSSTDNNV